jgi:hypothetical protein
MCCASLLETVTEKSADAVLLVQLKQNQIVLEGTEITLPYELITAATGWPGILILPALPTHRLPRSFAFFAKRREPEMLAPTGFDHVSTQNQVARSIAAHPFGKFGQALAKSGRTVHPQ